MVITNLDKHQIGILMAVLIKENSSARCTAVKNL
jgi:hypothetical protein